MKVLKKTLERLNGLHYRQECLCVDKDSFDETLQVYLLKNGIVAADVTNTHAFVGYCPLVFAFEEFIELKNAENINLIFVSANQIIGNKPEGRIVAELEMEKIQTQKQDENKLVYYKGLTGKHSFTNGFYQFIGAVYNNLYNRKP